MTRPARRALPLAVLLLLASVDTASAECAWVLWVETTESAPSTLRPSGEMSARIFNFTPIHAHETKSACDAMQAEFAEKERTRLTGQREPWPRLYHWRSLAAPSRHDRSARAEVKVMVALMGARDWDSETQSNRSERLQAAMSSYTGSSMFSIE